MPTEPVERLEATVVVAVSVLDRSPSTTTPSTAAPTIAAVLISVLGRLMNARRPFGCAPSSAFSCSPNGFSVVMSESMRGGDQSAVTPA